MISQKQKMKMQQRLTPQQLLLMKLLQLPVTALEQRIKDEVEKNPMLEVEQSSQTESIEPATDNDDDADNDFEASDFLRYSDDDDDDYAYRERQERDANYEQRSVDFASGSSFAESLVNQLSLRRLSDRELAIGNEIIGSIDGSGYLSRSLDMIANDLAFRSGIDPQNDEMQRLLAVVQSLDPAGVAARSLQECLSLQLHRLRSSDDHPDTALATTIVDNHFDMLSNKRYAALAATLGVDDSQLQRALAVIRRLNPKPGWGRDDEHQGAQYIVPDFIVYREGNELSFALNERNNPQLHLNAGYASMLQQLNAKSQLSPADRDTLQFIKSKTDSAQWFIDTLKQRQHTLSSTMAAILRYQKAYFLSGASADLKPMRLKDIAAQTDLDESTVSRVVNQKYVQCEFGTFLLKELFSKAVVADNGDVAAIQHVKEELRSIIDNEDKHAPFTDEALATELQKKGYSISRRTVTKYREAMDIPTGRLRREL